MSYLLSYLKSTMLGLPGLKVEDLSGEAADVSTISTSFGGTSFSMPLVSSISGIYSAP
jgi:hypothetical protein